MKFLAVALILLWPVNAFAAPVSTGKPKADPLAIPAFAPVPSEFQFAGTQSDLLGALQGFARGAKVEGAKPVSPTMNGETRLFSDPELLDMVSDIHVLRARSLSFRARGDKAYDEALKIEPTPLVPGTMSGGVGVVPDPQRSYDLEQSRLEAARKFYADAFARQGGSAQLSVQNGKTSMEVWVFKAPRSFALLTRGPSRVIVVRADGLPRLGAMGRLFRQIVAG